MIKVVPLSSFLNKEQRESKLYHGWTINKYKNTIYAFGTENLYTFQTDAKELIWKKTNFKNPPPPRIFHSSIIYQNSLIIFGGINEQTKKVYNDIYSFDFEKNTWSKIEPNNQNSISSLLFYGHTAILIPNSHKMLVHGNTESFETFIFDFQSLEWNIVERSKEFTNPPPRIFHSGCVISLI